MKENLIIAISGKSGCGNTSVGRMLSERLGVSFINWTFRNLAEKRGVSFEEALQLAEKDDSWDRELDSYQAALAREAGSCVLSSRLAVWLLKEEARLKVYLEASMETRAQRITKREGGSVEKNAAFTQLRDTRDRERYLSLYKIDNDVYNFVDLVIKTDALSVEQIVDTIIKKI